MLQQYKINHTTLTIDTENGALVGMTDEMGGTLIEGGGSILDLAIPIHMELEVLRTAPAFKYRQSAPVITFEDGTLTLAWERMALNCDMDRIDLPFDGGIEATVTVSPAPDGNSLVWRCRLKNNSSADVEQILFPSFSGILPVAGDDTRFTTMGFNTRPFKELKSTTRTREGFYASLAANSGVIYSAGGCFDSRGMIGRWYDIGGFDRGFSVWQKHWGWGPTNMNEMGRNHSVWVWLDSINNRLRISGYLDTTVEKGGEWDSGDFIMTPHSGGWAKGILPYRDYVNANKKRCVPMPERIAKTLGFRTAWICEQYEADPDAVIYKYSDFPMLAEDLKEHGLTELCIWGGFLGKLPISDECFYKQLGGFEEWKKSANTLREMGVHLSPLVSWLSIWSINCERYGLPAPSAAEAGWSENLKGIPMFRSPYMKRYCCHFLSDQNGNEKWRNDVRASLAFLRDEADTPDICWDQYLINPNESIYQIIDEYRKETLKKYPDAAFSGESTFYYEGDIDQQDYTWDWEYWPGVGDCRPYMNVVRTERPNMNIDSEPLFVKYSFMDNYMINAYPSKPNNINGSALIRDYPEYSKALKQCAALREKFLTYFLDADLVGECLLSEECTTARVTGYALPDSALIFAVKHSTEDAALSYDLTDWCGEGEYNITIYNADREIVTSYRGGAAGIIKLSGNAEELFAIELVKI
ncbi:MAG: hypothetical protein J6I45_04665 [Clostridia bacterium]|nr:hypothetical protein [Clostridia bacterium]